MSSPAPTYSLNEAQQLRNIAGALFAMKRPTSIPKDIFDADYATRSRLSEALFEIAEEIESAPGPVEIELVAPTDSRYTTKDSRDILYLVRTALV